MTSMCMAQVRISVSDLNGTKWRNKVSPRGHYGYNERREIWYGENRDYVSCLYYLTDRPIYSYKASSFDRSKVGKGTKGRYLVIYNETAGAVSCYSIEQFDKTKGIMTQKWITRDAVGEKSHTYVMIK